MKVLFKDLSKTKTPILTFCRKLLKDGYMGKLEIFRENRPEPDVVVSSVEDAARYTVRETQHEGPRFVKFKEGWIGSTKRQTSILEGDAWINGG